MSNITYADFLAMQARCAPKRNEEIANDAVGAGEEDQLHMDIMAECRRRGWIALHGSMAHRARRTVGEPDLHVLGDAGRSWLVECKTKHSKLSPAQFAMQHHAAKLGHTIHIVRSMREFLEVVK